MKTKPVLGLTMGDPAGIGPEICLRALRDAQVLEQCVPVLFGDTSILHRVDSSLSLSPKTNGHIPKPRAGSNFCRVVSLEEFEKIPKVTEPLIIECNAVNAGEIHPGKISAQGGRAAYIYIERAIIAALAGKTEGVVTAPIHKESLNLAGVKFPGQTEIFTSLTGAKRSCMMLYSDQFTVSMATTHIGYNEVPKKLSIERLLNVIELTADAMRRRLRREPRLGVCGLNPHAGEHGLFGNREEEIIVEPAVAEAQHRGIDANGPLVPDAVFTANMRKKFDAIVTLYHDQGHIPFKMLAFDTGVNVTLGLPIIRTSVDHGTAFDIAWQGKADPTSLYSAIRLAADLSQGKNEASTTAANGRLKRKSKILIKK
jgi:4-hydroxythreonine-4-phosphate dehydrogenase